MRFRFVPKKDLAQIPRSPGVYALGTKDEILYIGKASLLRTRIKNHFLQPSARDHFFIDQVTKAGYLETSSDIDALLLESEMIKRHMPRYNVMWRDDKKYFYVGITKEDLPRIFLTHQLAGGSEYLGPFVDGRALKRTLRLLRSVFPYYTVRKHPRLPCTYCQLGLCPGPDPDKQEYRKSVKRLKEVLQGKRSSVMRQLKQEMQKASKDQRYEHAAHLRDQTGALAQVIENASILPFSSEFSPLPSERQNTEETSLLLQRITEAPHPVRRIEAYDISNIQGNEATGSMVTFVDGKPAKAWYRKFKIRFGSTPNDFAMMQELLSRRLKHEEWPYPDLILIDGGKGQLSAALKAIKEKKGEFVVGALAKQKNELFLPGKEHSLLLEQLPNQVRNLLMYIRDEAHRFAITYHRTLMKKRESSS